MKNIIWIRLAFLILIGAVSALAFYGLIILLFAVLVPRMSDNAATWFLGALLGLWIWKFFPIMKAIFKWVKM